MLTKFTRRHVALATAVTLACSVCTPVASAADSAARTTTAAAAEKQSKGNAGNASTKSTATTGADEDDTVTRKVAPYKDPGLSSAPSSNEPGLSYAARGLSSQIVDPLGGIITLSMVAVAYLIIEDIYLQMENTRVMRERTAGQAATVVPLSSRVTSNLLPDDLAARLEGISSQLPH